MIQIKKRRRNYNTKLIHKWKPGLREVEAQLSSLNPNPTPGPAGWAPCTELSERANLARWAPIGPIGVSGPLLVKCHFPEAD